MEIQNQVKTNDDSSKEQIDEEIFIDIVNIPKSFIHFRTIKVRIGGARLEGNKVIFGIDKDYLYNTKRKFSDVNIEKEMISMRELCILNWFNYTRFQGINKGKIRTVIKIVIWVKIIIRKLLIVDEVTNICLCV